MLDAMEFAQCTPSLSQALRIKKLSADGKLTVRDMEDILSEIKQKEIDRVVFKTEQLAGIVDALSGIDTGIICLHRISSDGINESQSKEITDVVSYSGR